MPSPVLSLQCFQSIAEVCMGRVLPPIVAAQLFVGRLARLHALGDLLWAENPGGTRAAA